MRASKLSKILVTSVHSLLSTCDDLEPLMLDHSDSNIPLGNVAVADSKAPFPGHIVFRFDEVGQ